MNAREGHVKPGLQAVTGEDSGAPVLATPVAVVATAGGATMAALKVAEKVGRAVNG